MKPNWSDAPEWAEYVAKDGDSGWWWYDEEPKWHEWASEGEGEWQTRYGITDSANTGKDYTPVPARYTLEERP